jgi:cold shock CspA family protein
MMSQYISVSKKKYQGRVKWFNNKLGYGFISYFHCNKNKEIFVHWSKLVLPDLGYHTLFRGEIVDFEIEMCACEGRTIQASNVSRSTNSLYREFQPNHRVQNYNIFIVRQLSLVDLITIEKNSKSLQQIYS